MAREPHCRLYLVTPPAFEPAAFSRELAGALEAGDVACLQIKLTDASEADVRGAVDALRPVAHAHDVAVILNGPPELARATGCDGIHVNEGSDYAAARRVLGDKAIVGVACRLSRHAAMEAADSGADYVAFSPFFADDPQTECGDPDLVTWWSDIMEVPLVAAGGVTPENCEGLVDAGADFIAVSRSVWRHPDGPAAAVRAFVRALAPKT